MVNDANFSALRLLDDPALRRLLEYLLKNQAASALKMSYDLQQEPDALNPLIQKLLEAGLIQTVATKGGFGQTYIPTERGFRMKQYLSRPSPRQSNI
jgi:predicted transcriptional regulator